MSKTVLELKDQRAILTESADQLVELAKTEKRKLTTEEAETFKNTTVEISSLTNEIALEEVRQVEQSTKISQVKPTEFRKMENFSLLKAINLRANGQALTEDYQKVVASGQDEFRKSGLSFSGDIVIPMEYRADILAGTATQGLESVQTNKMSILAPLRANLVTAQAGATILTGLVGNVSIPTYTATSALWASEIGATTDGAGAFASVELAPKRLTAKMLISKQFLIQDSVQAEAMLMADIVKAISSKLEATIFGKANISSTQPLGLFYTAPAIKGVASWSNLVALETAVDTNNALLGNLKYITNPGARGILKSTVKATNTGIYLMDNNMINGYDALVTNNVASGLQTGLDEYGIIFGNWSDLVIGHWGGGFDLTVDPYTAAGTGEVVLTINAYFDAKVRRAESFKTGSVK